MRIARPVLLLFPFLLVSGVSNARQASAPAPRDASAVALLQRSLTALVGTNTIKDVTLTGSANYIAGSDNETGSATLKGTAISQGRIDLSLSDGSRSEVIDASQAAPTGSWCGSDGTWHAIAGHNLFTDPSWFFPSFLIARILSTSSYAVTAIDVETKDGSSVQHLAVYQQTPQADKLIANLSRTDIYLDPSTLLPAAVEFNIHPDSDALINIPMEIRFASYQNTQGISVPSHIQKYIQNGLALDVTVTSVQLNTGLTATDFQVQ